MTWGEAFETVAAETSAPSLTPAEVCAAHFAVLREVLTEAREPITTADLF